METQFKTNGKQFYPLKKLIIGILLFSSFLILHNFIGGTDGLVDMKKHIREWMAGFMSINLAIMFSALICLPIPIYMVYAAVSGLYRICTCNLYNPVFEDNTPGGIPIKGCDSYPNINRVLSYRESVLAGKSPDAGAELYIRSASLDALTAGTYNRGPETLRTISFIESKLSGMSNSRALNYLANKL